MNKIVHDEQYIIIDSPTGELEHDLSIEEYGKGFENYIEKNNINKMITSNKFYSGLYPFELGIYIDKQTVMPEKKEEDQNNIYFFAYFAINEYLSKFKFYLYLITRHIYDNIDYYSKNIILILPGQGEKIWVPFLYDDNWKINNFNFKLKINDEPNKDKYKYYFEVNNGENITKLFVFNKINFPHHEFMYYLKIAEEFVGCTGDQSISEVISLNKLPIYDMLGHKNNFIDSLKLYCDQVEYPEMKDFFIHSTEFYFEDESHDITFNDIYENIKIILSNKEKYVNFWNQFINEFNINDVLLGIVKFSIMNKFDKSYFVKKEIEKFNQFIEATDNIENFYREWYLFFN